MKAILKHKKKGIVNAFIGTLICIFIIYATVMLIIYSLQPLAIYSELREVGRGEILRMEAEGGLNTDIENDINDSLSKLGYNSSYLTITGDQASNNPSYGSKLNLNLSYQYHYKTFYFKTLFDIEETDSIQVINTHLSTSSKKSQ